MLTRWLGEVEPGRLYSVGQVYNSLGEDGHYTAAIGTVYFYIKTFNKCSCAIHVVASDNPKQYTKNNRIEYGYISGNNSFLHRVKRDELLPLMGKKFLDRPIFEQILKGKKARVD
jgi:hypothetical protein